MSSGPPRNPRKTTVRHAGRPSPRTVASWQYRAAALPRFRFSARATPSRHAGAAIRPPPLLRREPPQPRVLDLRACLRVIVGMLFCNLFFFYFLSAAPLPYRDEAFADCVTGSYGCAPPRSGPASPWAFCHRTKACRVRSPGWKSRRPRMKIWKLSRPNCPMP